MKMVKSLLLGSAAGLVAVTAGQAADLPVKAKPVEYVKVCSLYGAGFYYIPGTDTCIKIGGFLRTEWNIHAFGSFGTFQNGANGLQLRTEDNYVTRARASLTTDVREQTSYGTLRAYLAAGWQYSTDDAPTVSLPGAQSLASSGTSTFPGSSANGNLYLLRAFIQWGGFTFGKTASFFDFINTSKYTNQTNELYQDFGGNGIFTYGYTQQLGNGFAATIAVQDQSPFERPINQFGGSSEFFDFTDTGWLPSTSNTAGTLVPDIVGSIRVDQVWGGAQIAAAAHDNRATYYNTSAATDPFTGAAEVFAPGAVAGHPDDKWGWAGMAGIEFNLDTVLPFFAKGDTVVFQGQYCVGSSYYCYSTGGTRLNDVGYGLFNTNTIGLGTITDAYFTSLNGLDNSLQLSTAWNVVGAIQHYWIPEVRTSLYGIYFSYQANSAVVNVMCSFLNTGGTFGALHGSSAVSATGCADWSAWQVGSRTVWNPVKNLDLSIEAMYTALGKSAFQGATTTVNVPVGQIAAVGDTHLWSGILRIQYNFYP
jgi:Porin subfamily